MFSKKTDFEVLRDIALKAKEKGIAPLECYIVTTKKGQFMVKLSPRPTRVFDNDGNPVYLDSVIRIKKYSLIRRLYNYIISLKYRKWRINP